MLITLLQSGVSLLSNSWLVYVGVMFIAMVIFAPTGLAGMIQAHGPIRRAGRLHAFSCHISGCCPGLAWCFGFVGLVELISFLTIGAAQGRNWSCSAPRSTCMRCCPGHLRRSVADGRLVAALRGRGFHRVWENLTAEARR